MTKTAATVLPNREDKAPGAASSEKFINMKETGNDSTKWLTMTEKIELAPHIEDINRALRNKVGVEKIEAELKEYTNVYQLPLYEAKQSIVKKYGGDPALLRAAAVEKPIAEISLSDRFVDVVGLVRSLNAKEASVRGESKTIFYGQLVGQDGSSISFTAWEDPRLEKGQLVRFRNSRITPWRDRPQLNINGPYQVEMLKLDDHVEFRPENIRKDATIAGINPGDSFIAVGGLVLNVERREHTQKDGTQSAFFSGMLGDGTGIIPFTCWRGEPEIKEGDFLELENVYAREWRGMPQLTVNDGSTLRIIETPPDFPSAENILSPKEMTLGEVEAQGGGTNVVVTGILIDVKKNSGLILRCPDCKRIVQKGSCLHHGEVEGIPDLRIKGVFDDGEAAVSLILGRELTEKLFGMSLQECEDLVRKKMDPTIIQEKLEDKLLTMPISVRGNILKDEFGFTMIASDAEPTNVNVVEQAEELLQTLGVRS